jgi:hypothetical protein
MSSCGGVINGYSRVVAAMLLNSGLTNNGIVSIFR